MACNMPALFRLRKDYARLLLFRMHVLVEVLGEVIEI